MHPTIRGGINIFRKPYEYEYHFPAGYIIDGRPLTLDTVSNLHLIERSTSHLPRDSSPA